MLVFAQSETNLFLGEKCLTVRGDVAGLKLCDVVNPLMNWLL